MSAFLTAEAQRAQRERGVSLRMLRVLCACGGEAWLDVCKPTSLNLNRSRIYSKIGSIRQRLI